MSSIAVASLTHPLFVGGVSATLLLMAGLVGNSSVGLLCLAVVLVLALVSPVGTLGASVATLPWFFHPLTLGSQHFPASEILLFASVFGAFGLTLADVLRGRTRGLFAVFDRVRATMSDRVVIAAIVLVFTGAMLVLFPYDAAHRAESFREWRWTLLEPCLLVALLTWLERDAKVRTIAALALATGAVIASGQGLIDYMIGGGVAVEGVRRIAGPYPHPNALALYVTRAVSFLAMWWWLRKSDRRWLTPLLVVCGLAMLATLSRGAILGIGAAILVVVPIMARRIQVVTITGGAVAVLTLTVVARDRMLDLFSGGSGSLRLDIWGSALQMIRDRPFAGYGPDQFLYAYLPRYVQPTAWNERFTAHAHNLLLDFWIRLGIIGIALAVAACIVVASSGIRLWMRHWRGNTLATAGLVALVAVVAHGLVDNAYFAHDLAMSGWLLAWLAFGPGSRETAEGVSNGARPRYGRRWIHRFSPVRQFARGRS